MKQALWLMMMLVAAPVGHAQLISEGPDYGAMVHSVLGSDKAAQEAENSAVDSTLNFLLSAYEGADPDDVGAQHLCRPVDGVITSRFGYRRLFRRQHNGIDLLLCEGDTVRAFTSGTVKEVGFQPKGYGNYMIISHDNGLETLYGHLSGFMVWEGASVIPGQAVGLGGNTGRSTGPHLHFETRRYGQIVNPETLYAF